MRIETARFSLELPERWAGIVGADKRRERLVLRLLWEQDPARSGILAVLRSVRDRDAVSGEGTEYLGRLTDESGACRYLFAVWGEEGACSEEHEELYFRLCDGLWKVFESIRPARGWRWEPTGSETGCPVRATGTENTGGRQSSMILFLNACVRTESRTKRLADALLALLGGEVCELRLEDLAFPKTDEAFLRRRDGLIAARRFDDSSFALARQFAAAEQIVIAAPYWDLSFPAALKQYFEIINVLGLTFQYTPEGTPLGLCRAKRLWYVTTAGGTFVPEEYGFGYVKALAESFYGIRDVRQVRALGLDIDGADSEDILRRAVERLPDLL